jgi:hypothetical protein
VQQAVLASVVSPDRPDPNKENQISDTQTTSALLAPFVAVVIRQRSAISSLLATVVHDFASSPLPTAAHTTDTSKNKNSHTGTEKNLRSYCCTTVETNFFEGIFRDLFCSRTDSIEQKNSTRVTEVPFGTVNDRFVLLSKVLSFFVLFCSLCVAVQDNLIFLCVWRSGK